MKDEYNDYDYVDPKIKEFANKHDKLLLYGVVAFILSWPAIVFLFCL